MCICTCIHKYMCVRICIYIYICLYLYMNICIYLHIHIYIQIYMYMYMYIYVYVCVHVHVHVHICIPIHINVCIYIHMFIHVQTHMHMHIYLYIYACIYLCIHICRFYVQEGSPQDARLCGQHGRGCRRGHGLHAHHVCAHTEHRHWWRRAPPPAAGATFFCSPTCRLRVASHVTCLFVQPMQKDSTSCGILTNLTLQAMAMRPHGVDPFAIDIPFEVETGILFFLSFFFCILFKLQWHFDHAGLYVHETQVCLKFDGIGWPSARRMACARPANTSGRFA